MAVFTEPKKWGVVPGNAADVSEIQEKGSSLYPSLADFFPAIYQLALSAGGKAPERATFNALFKMIMERLYFIERGGLYAYDATVDYPAGALVGYSGAVYLALKDNGSGTGTGAVTPGKNTSVWQKLVLESGNAATATKLAAKRTIALSGAATGTATAFDGSGNITIPVTSLDASKLTGTASVSTTGNAATATTATTAKACTGNAATATKLAAKRTIALSGAATGTATGFDGSGNITIPVTALASSAIRAQWYAAYPDGPEAHNAMWGGRDITAAFNNGTFSTNVANGTFRDIFPGDYITKQVTISGTAYTVNWVIADCDYWINKGDQGSGMTTHHVVIVPQAPIFNANMNATNTTDGGYAGSRMYRETIPACATGIVSAFGSSHILTFRDSIVRAVNTSSISSGAPFWTGASSDWGWYDAQCNLMCERMVYGMPAFSSSAWDAGVATRQFSAFRLSERLINYNRNWWWLRDVVSSAFFARVGGSGSAGAHYASDVFGVRPFALLV